ncbi:PREDICTED: protein FAM212B, partial [Apaloderma vittatum]|uniref:protein FAM212B n=1 Tax=Apaloderma vittatum TaxID=57397 RepID=UPI0005219D72
LSMKEVGDGLHEQMNCMMGALQELKLLQVQAALEQLDISGSRIPTPGTEWHPCCRGGRAMPVARRDRAPELKLLQVQAALEQLDISGSRIPTPGTEWHPCCRGGRAMPVARRDRAPVEEPSPTSLACAVRRPADLSRPTALPEGGHLRDTPSSFGGLCGEGDNIFADLVGNWLDLPELDKKGEKSEASLPTSRSQELCRKFSLTANIFKKFLRSVRPDRDRLLKEKPCWLPPEDKQPEISKRSKKMNKLKGTFYFPLHGNIQNHHGKAERCSKAESNSEKPKIGTKKVHETIDCTQSGFDINTAVWV